MSAPQIHTDDWGTMFEVTVVDQDGDVADISGATAKVFRFKDPSGNTVDKGADFVTDGSDGKIKYVTQDGDIDEVGDWKLQAIVTLPSGEWFSEILAFPVLQNLATPA